MAVGLHVSVANDILDAIGNNSALTTLPLANGLHVRLHVGDPGADGDDAVAGNATVKGPISFGAPAGGLMSNDVDVVWSIAEVDTDEDYTHWSGWAEVGATTPICSGLLTSNPVVTGDEFTIPAGDLDLSFGVMA